MNIVVDAMGGDHAPEAPVLGSMAALNEGEGFSVTLVGDEKKISEILLRNSYRDNRIKIIHATEVVTNDDSPTKVFKQKKNSSMVMGFNMLKNHSADMLISAGSTGALMACGLFMLGRIQGIDRPALPFYFPTDNGPTLVLDAGANTLCKPINYLQFGIMGSIYMKDVFGIKEPKVGLINVGSEESKGNENIKNAYSLLSNSLNGFIGNIEGRDIPEGKVNVAVCDGFVGNVLLKFAEGIAKFFFDNLKKVYSKNTLTSISGLIIRKELRKLKKKVDYTEYGGVPLLGIQGKVVKCHGSSNEKAFKNAILRSIPYAKSKVIEEIEERMKILEVDENV